MSRARRPAWDWEARKAATASAFARPRAASQGPPLTDASLPLRPGDRARGPDRRRPRRTSTSGGSGSRSQRLPPLPQALRSGLGPAGIPFFPTLSPAPPLRLPPAALTCSRSRRRASRPGPRRRVCDGRRGSAALSRRHHSAFRRGAGLASATAAGGRRAAGAWRGDTAALRPAGEEQPHSIQPREGGWAAVWGGVSACREGLPRRPGGLPLPASPAPAGFGPRPLVRPRAQLGRVGPPRLAGPGDPGPRLPPLRLPSVSGSRPGALCRTGPALPRLERKPDVFPPSPVVGSHGGASPLQCVGFSRWESL